MHFHIAGEHIKAGSEVVKSSADSKLYSAVREDGRPRKGAPIGKAASDIREGFRAISENAEVREDDA